MQGTNIMEVNSRYLGQDYGCDLNLHATYMPHILATAKSNFQDLKLTYSGVQVESFIKIRQVLGVVLCLCI